MRPRVDNLQGTLNCHLFAPIFRAASMEDTSPLHISTSERTRRHVRIAGPFEGWWVRTLPVPVHIHDLSAGGCLVQSYHEDLPGRRLALEIDLPFHGRVSLEAETVSVRERYGFAVRFVDVPPEVRVKLNDVVLRLRVVAPPPIQVPALW